MRKASARARTQAEEVVKDATISANAGYKCEVAKLCLDKILLTKQGCCMLKKSDGQCLFVDL